MLGPDATVPEILRASASVIRERGWNQEGWYTAEEDDPGSPVCMYGAINLVLRDSPFPAPIGEEDPREKRADEVLAEVTGYGDIPEWNDAPGRTVEEVLAAFEAAAVAEEEATRGEATGDPTEQGPDHGRGDR